MMNYLKTNLELKYTSISQGLLIILLSAVVFFGCKKPEDIGQEIVALPGEQPNVSFTDTVGIRAYSFTVDSISTKSVHTQILGGMFDPVFGSSISGIYTQVRMANTNLEFGANAVCDSIVLSLEYSGFYGSDAELQNIKVYELDEDMYTDSPYFSNRQLATKSSALFDQNIRFYPNDSILLDGELTSPHLRMRLPNSFGDHILSKSGQDELKDNEEFLKFLKGFYISAEEITNGGGLSYMDLIADYSRLTLYYHNDQDTTFEHFVINTNCARYTYFNHFDYYNSSPEFNDQVIKGDTLLGDQQFYLQPMAGVRSYIHFPHLNELTKENMIAVQKAELIINVSEDSEVSKHPAPGRLILVGIDENGKNVHLTDYAEGEAFYGGYYDEDANQYVFTITRTIQELLLGESRNHGFRLVISGEAVSANRLVLNGNKSTVNNTRLRIYYTDI